MAVLVAEERNTFGEWLEKRLDDKAVTQSGLAKAIGMSREQIRRILRGESGTKRETVIEIALAIGEKPRDVLRVWYDLENHGEYLEALDDDEREVLSFYRGTAPDMRPATKAAMKALRDSRPDDPDASPPFGRKPWIDPNGLV